jgi:hypothetical protein
MVGGAIATVLALSSFMAFGAQLSQPTNNLPNPYQSIADWVKMPDAEGCAADKDGIIYDAEVSPKCMIR